MVVRVFLAACVFITPAVFDLGAVKPFDIVKLTTVLFFGWLALGVWLAAVVTGQARPRRFLMGYLAGAYLLVATVATIFSPTKWTSLIGWYGRHHGLLTILIYVVVFYLIASVYRQRPDRAHEVVYAMGAGAAAITVYILMQKTGLDPIEWARPSGEVPGQPYFGTMGNANFAGGYIGLTTPWLYLAFMRSRETWKRVAVVVWGLIGLYALWLTSARNGIVALAAAIAAFLFIHRDRVPLVLKLGAAVVALVAVALAVIIIWHPGSDRPPEALRRVDILRSQTIQVRGYWWLAGVKMFADRPVQGWGPDTFVTKYPAYLSPEAAKIGDAETADKPHNVFVEHLAHTGALGFGAYIALLFVALRRALRRMREAQRNEKALLTTLVGLLAAYVGQAFFSIDVTAIALVGWVTLGCIAALADPVERTPEPPASRRRGTGARVLAAVAIVAGMVLAALSNAPLKADHESRTAQRLANADGFIDDVRLHHDRAFTWNPIVPQYRAIAGAYLEKQANTADGGVERDLLIDAVERYREADRLQPGFHGWKMAMGKVVAQLAAADGAEFDEALELIEEARRLAPYDWRVPASRGDVYNLWATVAKEPDHLCEALASYETATKLYRRAGESWTGVGRTLARLGRLDESIVALKRAAKFDKVTELPEQLIAEVEKLQRKKDAPPEVDCP
jgi:tetratricopeptide (TPR) repeat protein